MFGGQLLASAPGMEGEGLHGRQLVSMALGEGPGRGGPLSPEERSSPAPPPLWLQH